MSEILIYGPGAFSINEKNNGKFVRYVKELNEFKKRVLTEDYLMIIIDLERRNRYGISAAEFAREIPRQSLTPIIFLCQNHDYELEAFHRVHCYDYMIKPLSPQDMLKLVSLCMQRLSRKTDDGTIVFQAGQKKYKLKRGDICFIESIGRKIRIVTPESSIKAQYFPLNDFLGQYGQYFIKIHRSIIVNKSYMLSLNVTEYNIELTDGHTLPVGRKYLSSVRKEFDEVSCKRYTRRKNKGDHTDEGAFSDQTRQAGQSPV